MTAAVQADEWAVAVLTHGMLGVGERIRSQEEAIERARQAPTLTLTIANHPDTGGPVTLTDVSPLVYRDDEYGWTFEENRWSFADVTRAAVDQSR
jgi:hypothetical protein